MARQPTARELAIYKEFRSTVLRGRPVIRGWLGAVETMATIEMWRRNQVDAGLIGDHSLPVAFTAAEIVSVRQRVAMWNQLEKALAGLESQRMTFVIRPNTEGKPDISVYEPVETMLGAVPLVALGGLLIITAGIVTAIGLITSCENEATRLKRDLANIDAQMAKQPKPVRDAYATFRSSTDYTEPKSAWDKLTGGLASIGKGAGMLLLVVGGVWAFSKFQEARNRSPVPNPCGPTAPEDWNVNWSEDPEKAERQLEHILDDLRDRSLAKKWEGYFEGLGDYYGATGSEVPF